MGKLKPAYIDAIAADGADRLGMGGNGPPQPTPFDAIRNNVLDLKDEALATLTGAAIVNAEQAAAVTRLVQQARAAESAADTQRKADKAPHLLAGKAVDLAYEPLLADCARIKASGLAALTPWQETLDAALRAAAALAAQVAADKIAAANAAHRAVDVTDIASQEDAERITREAKAAVQSASAAAKAKAIVSTGEGRGIGLKSYWTAEVTDMTAWARWVWANRLPELTEFLTTLAQREVAANKVERISPERISTRFSNLAVASIEINLPAASRVMVML